MPDTTQKRKRPPTFQHYPANRAKKLKQEWVEKAKIKSKWKAQKRREGIAPLHPGVTPREEQNGDNGSEGFGHSGSDSESQAQSDSLSDNESSNAANDSVSVPPPRTPKPLPPKKRKLHDSDLPSTLHNKNNSANTGKDGGDDGDELSLRDLFQKAYSRSSLHTYKSDPLKRRRNDQTQGRGFSRGGRGGAASARGRGQPNMKLRMNAMLEKIKRDHA
ncbi:hypothetical protein P691DRAFT_795236 [Macrolepiota fuliginosa MF-IS2]|uniref:rRNA-processing protein FYV7 n=1 Tax=Macrolepiota fuliginosa MF-IS2 TaxID=1400762 RepID=A0A9P6C5B6_9AGAR|nr:hypothetical protein P691DRAFT_795236 [Macrolepiota fuliginosa MF-IS2]